VKATLSMPVVLVQDEKREAAIITAVLPDGLVHLTAFGDGSGSIARHVPNVRFSRFAFDTPYHSSDPAYCYYGTPGEFTEPVLYPIGAMTGADQAMIEPVLEPVLEPVEVLTGEPVEVVTEQAIEEPGAPGDVRGTLVD